MKLLRPKDVLEASAIAHRIDVKLSDLKVKSFSKVPATQSIFLSPLQTLNSNTLPENKSRIPTVRRLTPEEVDFL